MTGLAAALAAALVVLVVVAAPTRAAGGCDRVTSPAPGAVQALADALAPGQVGCLRAGTYQGNVTVRTAGRAGAPVVLESYPGEDATISGRLVIAPGADFVTVRDLGLDGSTSPPDDNCTTGGGCGLLPSPTVVGNDATFEDDDVTNEHHGICFDIGGETSAPTHNTRIDATRIHDCGRLPATNHDHGIYVNTTDRTQITNDWIYANADRGIQLYPDAQRTTITGNVIAGNGEGIAFGSDSSISPSSGTVVAHNIIADSTQRWNVEAWWGGAAGVGNVVETNCLSSGNPGYTSDGGVQSPSGFTVDSNVTAAPGFVDAAAHDYRLAAGSPCSSVFGPPTGGATAASAAAATAAPAGPRIGGATPASAAKSATARFAGRLRPHRGQATYYFQYGMTDRYGHRTAVRHARARMAGTTVAVIVAGLRAHTVYHYRLIVRYRRGISVGADRTVRS